MEKGHNLCYVFYAVGWGVDFNRQEKRFNYPTNEMWDETRLRSAIEGMTAKKYRVKKIELIEKEGAKAKITNVPLPKALSKL